MDSLGFLGWVGWVDNLDFLDSGNQLDFAAFAHVNADAGFDSKEFRLCCEKKEINANVCFNKRNGNTDRDEYFDQLLYNERYKIERTNAWMDSFRSLLNRFDTTIASWLGFNYLAFIIIALKKFNKIKV